MGERTEKRRCDGVASLQDENRDLNEIDMNKSLRIVLTSVGATVACAYILGAIVFLPDHKQEQVCQKFDITIADSSRHQFVSSEDMRKRMRAAGVFPENKPFDEIRTQAVEDVAINTEVVSSAECYKTSGGVVSLRVIQREPCLRVMGSGNYYVDTDREIMQASYKTACRVPVVTGHVTEEMAKSELFDFVEWLSDNDFWNAQIEQINVLHNHEVELIPRVGGHVILIGRLENYEQKLDKLRVFYDEGLSKMGWLPYKEVDLRFSGQVVCR